MKLTSLVAVAASFSMALVSSANAGAQIGDAKFVRDMAIANMAEIQLGRLAAERGSSDFVRAFGKQMVDDHQMALNELSVIAENGNPAWPKDVDAKHRALYQRLSVLSGPMFDSVYKDAMIKGHKAVFAMLSAQSRYGSVERLRDYAMLYAPIVQEHLRMVAEGNMGGMKMGR